MLRMMWYGVLFLFNGHILSFDDKQVVKNLKSTTVMIIYFLEMSPNFFPNLRRIRGSTTYQIEDL